MKAKLVNKSEIAKGTIQFDFELLGGEAVFKAGQFSSVELINPKYSDQKGNKRYFSIVNSPNEKNRLTFATRISDSAFKRSLIELSLGSEVEIQNPMGKFVLPEDKTRPIVFISGGIGITPFISMLRFIKEEKLEYRITLIYSGRDQASTPFLAELKSYSNIKLVLTLTDDGSWTGEKRRVNSIFIKESVNDIASSVFFVVGPPPMVAAVTTELKKLEIKPEAVIIENFAGY
jgi:ferredoxin-NADP reductase